MRYVIYFSDSGNPKESLTPTIDVFIKVSDGTSAGTPPTVNEFEGGFYYFDYVPTERAIIRVNSGDIAMSDLDKYIVVEANPDDDFAEIVKDIEEGKWIVDKTTGKLTLYKRDGITVLKQFDLSDDSSESKREPI